MRCVREDENVADDAVRLDAVCERLRELETDDGWRGKLLAEVDGAAATHGWSSEKLLVRIDAVFLVDWSYSCGAQNSKYAHKRWQPMDWRTSSSEAAQGGWCFTARLRSA